VAPAADSLREADMTGRPNRHQGCGLSAADGL